MQIHTDVTSRRLVRTKRQATPEEIQMELARYAASQGYGWQDLCVSFGLLPSEARELVGLSPDTPGEEE
jgi:hypothetical protein